MDCTEMILKEEEDMNKYVMSHKALKDLKM